MIFAFSVLNWVFTNSHSKSAVYLGGLQITINLALVQVHISRRHSNLSFAYHFVIYWLFQNGTNKNNTRNHTKQTPYLINLYFFFKIGNAKKSTGWARYMYVCEWDMCWRNFCNFPWWLNKAVLEPQVLPAFAVTYFCNHCNIRFENTSKYVDTLTLFSKNLNQRSLTPRWPLIPCLLRSHVWLYPRIIVSKSPWQYINVCGYSDRFYKIPHTYMYYILHTYILRTEWVIT